MVRYSELRKAMNKIKVFGYAVFVSLWPNLIDSEVSLIFTDSFTNVTIFVMLGSLVIAWVLGQRLLVWYAIVIMPSIYGVLCALNNCRDPINIQQTR